MTGRGRFLAAIGLASLLAAGCSGSLAGVSWNPLARKPGATAVHPTALSAAPDVAEPRPGPGTEPAFVLIDDFTARESDPDAFNAAAADATAGEIARQAGELDTVLRQLDDLVEQSLRMQQSLLRLRVKSRPAASP